MTLTVGSLFSGVEGFGQGFEAAGFAVLWQVEIDRDAVSVLERHYPDTLRVRDVRVAGIHNLPPVDVITFGSPCQGFSVAGRGEGLEDVRSGLFGEAIRIIRELRPALAIWENVPGAFSANDGRDFGAVLASLAESGAVDIAWRVLDAQWFGIPQRRRRIFLVADFRAERAVQILFESEGSGGHLEACGETGQGLAGDIEDGAGVVGIFAENYHGARGTDTAPTIGARHGLDPLQNAGGLMVATGGITGENGQIIARATNCQQGIGDPTAQTFIAETVRSHPRPGSNSVGNIVVDATNAAQGAGVAGTLGTEQAKGNRGQFIAFQELQSGMRDNETFATLDSNYGSRRHNGVATAAPLAAGGHLDSNAPGRRQEDDENLVAVAPWDDKQATCPGIRGTVEYGAPAHTLHTGGQGIVTPMAVRRLTPRECERLMGWPDDWTRYRANGQEISDGPRYRMIGNGVVAPVARWIACRMRAALEAAS